MCLRHHDRDPTASRSGYVTVCNRRQLAPTVDGYITHLTVTTYITRLTVSERVIKSELILKGGGRPRAERAYYRAPRRRPQFFLHCAAPGPTRHHRRDVYSILYRREAVLLYFRGYVTDIYVL